MAHALLPQVLSWIDLCAGMSAKTLARGTCVTASVDAVHFLRPARLGDVVAIAAMVARTFASSMEVRARAHGVGFWAPAHHRQGRTTKGPPAEA